MQYLKSCCYLVYPTRLKKVLSPKNQSNSPERFLPYVYSSTERVEQFNVPNNNSDKYNNNNYHKFLLSKSGFVNRFYTVAGR